MRLRLVEACEAWGDGDQERLVPGPCEADFTLGDGEVCDALECAASRMGCGEIAAVRCTQPALVQRCGPFALKAPTASGEAAGSSSYRALFLVELLSVHGEDPLTWVAPAQQQQRLDLMVKRKEAGTAAYKAGRVQLARERFRRTANFLSVGLGTQSPLPGSYDSSSASAATELRRVCWLNAAQCELILGRPAPARRYCDAVLLEDAGNMKALFRRASALLALGEVQQAAEDLRKLLVREPGDLKARQMLRQAEQAQKKRDCESEVFKKGCSDLACDVDGVKMRLEAAQLYGDPERLEEALKELAEAMPRVTAGKATRLRLRDSLERIAAGASANAPVRDLASGLLQQVVELQGAPGP